MRRAGRWKRPEDRQAARFPLTTPPEGGSLPPDWQTMPDPQGQIVVDYDDVAVTEGLYESPPSV